MSRGRRESQWGVMCRCLAIIHRAQRGPASREELIQAVLLQEGPTAYGEGVEDEARQTRFENDLGRIRDKLGVDLYFDRRADGYVIKDTWRPLLDLPDEDLATIAWLEQTFDHDSPQHDEVHALLGRLRFYLAPERRGKIERCRAALVMDLGQRDEDKILPAVWDGLTRALTLCCTRCMRATGRLRSCMTLRTTRSTARTSRETAWWCSTAARIPSSFTGSSGTGREISR